MYGGILIGWPAGGTRRKRVQGWRVRCTRRLRRLGLGDGEEQKRTAILGVERMLAAVMAALAESGAAGKDGSSTTSYVVTQTEEERGLTVPTYNADDVSGQKALLVRMYNHRMREHELATLPSMKKIVYRVKKEGSWPHPDRVSLESMRRDKSDSSFTLAKRLINSVAEVAAGEKPAGRLDA